MRYASESTRIYSRKPARPCKEATFLQESVGDPPREDIVAESLVVELGCCTEPADAIHLQPRYRPVEWMR